MCKTARAARETQWGQSKGLGHIAVTFAFRDVTRVDRTGELASEDRSNPAEGRL